MLEYKEGQVYINTNDRLFLLSWNDQANNYFYIKELGGIQEYWIRKSDFVNNFELANKAAQLLYGESE